MLPIVFALFALATSAMGQAPSSPNTVNVGYATYVGNQSYSNVVAYLGIPYAEPPLGNLRFRAPVPLNTSRITAGAGGKSIMANTYPNFCIQGTTNHGDYGGAGTEDCLHVNIYAPAGAGQGDNLPVLVYMHGGGFVYGNPRNWPFDPWVHQSPNVVIVSVYYRLDAFGFLTSEAMAADSSLGDLNAGFLDQVQALRWVNQYISYFGGNPNHVTINGQSAGGTNVEMHMVSSVGRDLFQGAIAQSLFRTPMPTPAEQQPLFEWFTSYVGCNGTDAAIMACLRNTSVATIAHAEDYAFLGGFTASYYNTFHPVLDGTIFTGYPTAMFQAGDFAQVPLIVGSTSNETLSSGGNIQLSLEEYFPSITQAEINNITALYPLSEFANASQRYQVLTGEPDVICGRQAMGVPSSKYQNTWTYRYNTPNPTTNSPYVAHSAENWMMFQGINTGGNGSGTFTYQNPVQLSFASELIAYWLSFTRVWNPNTYKLSMSPEWNQYLPNEGQAVRLVLQQDPANLTTQSGSYMETQPTNETLRCDYIISIVQSLQD